MKKVRPELRHSIQRIKDEMEAQEIPVLTLAKEAKVSKSMLYQMFRFERTPTIDVYARLAGFLNIPIDVDGAPLWKATGRKRSA